MAAVQTTPFGPHPVSRCSCPSRQMLSPAGHFVAWLRCHYLMGAVAASGQYCMVVLTDRPSILAEARRMLFLELLVGNVTHECNVHTICFHHTACRHPHQKSEELLIRRR